jgi:antitoxin component YwqK of YwqJK toxin-antitoxin module
MISYRESQLLDMINKPTEVLSNGTKIWKNKEGEYHRGNDKPAIEWHDGAKHWYINGKLHRENDKPAIEWESGKKEWYINGKFIKQNYDKDFNIHNDKFFDYSGDEIIGE